MMPRQIVQGTPKHRTYRLIGWALAIAALVVFAMAYNDVGQVTIGGNQYNLSLIRVNKAIGFMVAILGLQVIVGYTGQIALGQSVFFGLGAYTTAYLVQDQHWAYLTTLIVVIPFCFLVGMVLGLPALRIQGLYLALVTLAVAAIFPSLLRLDQVFHITNGSNGKSVESDLVAPSWLPLDALAGFLQAIPLIGDYFGDGDLSQREADRVWKFMLFIIVAGVCFWMVANLINSRPGRAIRAIRDNEASAAVSGIDLAMTKTLAFGVGSALGGVGGTIYVMELGIASPDDFTQLLAINFIVGLVVGGVGTLSGALIGGLIITLVPDWASSTKSVGFLPDRWLQGPTGTLLLGVLLIALTFFLPGGIAAALRQLRGRFVQILPSASASSTLDPEPSAGQHGLIEDA
jgi:branched-chain amino acid transport system permease protein